MCLLAAHLLQCCCSLCLHSGSGLLLSGFYIASLCLRRFPWVGHRREVYAPSFLCVWNQRPMKSLQIIVASSFFARIPSIIRRIVKIYDVADLFLRKPFWFFLSIFSILGSMQLRSRALYILATMDVRVIPR